MFFLPVVYTIWLHSQSENIVNHFTRNTNFVMGQVLGYLLGIFIGGFLCYQGFWRVWLLRRLKQNGVKAEGIIVGQAQGDPALTAVPAVRFYDHLGNEIVGVPINSIPTRPYSPHLINDKVWVYYNRANSSQFVIDTLFDKFVAIFILGLGCLFLLAVIYLF